MEDCPFETLTGAERGVLRAALGRTNDSVAAILGISPSTVATHMLAARRKLGSPPRGEAARRFVEWEQGQRKPTKPIPTMEAAPTIGDPIEADAELLREMRTPFVFLDQPAPAARLSATPDQVVPMLRMVLLLTLVVLMLAAIRFLPDLRERAEQAGRALDPILRETGVKRSG